MDVFNETKQRLGLSNQELANYFGVSLSTMAAWKKGTRSPSDAAIQLLTVLELIEQYAPHLHQKIMLSCRVGNKS